MNPSDFTINPAARLLDVPRFSPPMYFPPSPFDYEDATAAALLVNAAYDQFAQWAAQKYPPKGSFHWVPPFTISALNCIDIWGTCHMMGGSYEEPFGFIGVTREANPTAYIGIRGTMTDADEYEDGFINQTLYSTLPGFGYVHAGFFDIFQTLKDDIRSKLDPSYLSGLLLTGHSLGSGLSTLVAPFLSSLLSNVTVRHYNFASPRVGDPQFAYRTNRMLKTYRIVNTEDLVPDAPPSVSGWDLYKHVGEPVDFTAQYGTTAGNHSMLNCYTYAINNPQQPEGPIPPTLNGIIGEELKGVMFPPDRLIHPTHHTLATGRDQ